MSDAKVSATDEHVAWVRDLAASRRFGEHDRIGTANLIDDAARARAAAAIRTGRAVSLARALENTPSVRGDGLPAYRLDTFVSPAPPNSGPQTGFGSDHVELDCHGRGNTHIDALNHIRFDEHWYGGWSAETTDGPSVEFLATAGIVTRAVHVDIAKVRGTEWIDPTAPVTGADFDAAFAAAGVVATSGDAVLIDMGRDRFEAAGATLPEGYMPGVGADGARWIESHGVSVVCWDFLDATVPDGPAMPVHLLNWAIGLVLVDNCDFAALHADTDRAAVGALVVAPLRMVGATGSNVNPLFVC